MLSIYDASIGKLGVNLCAPGTIREGNGGGERNGGGEGNGGGGGQNGVNHCVLYSRTD